MKNLLQIPKHSAAGVNKNPAGRLVDTAEVHTDTLYGAIFVRFLSSGCAKGPIHFFYLRVSLFDLAARFFAPTHTFKEPARAGAVKDGALAPPQGLVLDGCERDGTLGVVGMTTSRGARGFVHEHSCTSLYAVGAETRTMMQ